MKITKVDVLNVDAGWRPWIYVKIETDEGITGYGECSDGRNPWAVTGCVRDLTPLLVGQDPGPVEMLYTNMYRVTRQSPGGIAQKAIAGIDCALWDIKGKALGVPVHTLFGGPTRESVRVYWSHCGTYRARNPEILGTPPLRTMDDIYALGKEVVRRGFTCLKTNIVYPGNPATVLGQGWAGPPGSQDLNITPQIVRHLEKQVGTFREAVGDDVDICLDLNFHFKTEGFMRVAKAMEPFNLQWLEIDTYDPQALLQIKQSTSTRICSGENLFTTRDYRPFFDLHAMDVAMIDVPWNGFTPSKKIADLAEIYEINVAPHNYYSHLSSFISANLCAVANNVRIMEMDIDAVPWRDDLVTEPPEIVNGYMKVPTKPGWGVDLNEKEMAKHPWPK
ncbi:MAG: mandelate racemase/muconate lactonizing enzyme family protein [Bacteroidetes bacterium]|nr:mandelate racemase/muconate lactonizing enzyme family protein [Bacteroidota bacterium]MCL5026692.1 mandelate racemase/muconate lactonizing enzyme family protein [Chloroflexota bacterium]